MKKVLSLALALTLIFAMAIPAMANNVEVKASVAESYEITIPAATTTLTWGVTTPQTFGDVGLRAAKLELNHQVNIAISGNDGLVNSIDENAIIQYTVKDGENEFTSANFCLTAAILFVYLILQ